MSDELRARDERSREAQAAGGQEEGGTGGSWYRQAVEQSPNPIFRVDAEGFVRSWNRSGLSLLSEAPEGRRCADFLRLPDGSALEPLLERVRGGETIGGIELSCTSADGSTRVLLVWLYPAYAPDGTLESCIVFGADVSDRVRFEAELVAAKEAAEAAVQLKSTILNNLSHEIRTPLTAILGFAELLYEEVPEPYREFVHLIRGSGKRLMGTLVSVLELARLESGDVRFETETLDLIEEAREAVRMFAAQADQKSLRLSLLAPERILLVQADRIALNRIFGNLLSNAIKFTPDGYVEVELQGAGEEVVVVVRDTGIGMGEAFLPYLFEEFKQESEGLARRHEGAGLGLAITKRLVEQMGGQIAVASVKGQGSTFTVRLPRAGPPPRSS